MEFVNIHEAKTHLSQYLKKVKENNEIVVICKNGVPMGQLCEYHEPNKRKIGLLKNKLVIKDNFNDELPSEIIKDYV